MHLKQNTDYALRVLMYAARKRDQQVSAREISDFYGISYSHTVKIVNKLGKLGYLDLRRGRYGGGINLALDPAHINIATVVRQFESSLDVVECFNPETNSCPISIECRLKHVFQTAMEAFFASLENKTLADVLPQKTA